MLFAHSVYEQYSLLGLRPSIFKQSLCIQMDTQLQLFLSCFLHTKRDWMETVVLGLLSQAK